jgi:hypothetical protein
MIFKKAQEEIVGFVVIIIIVAIIMLVFLGIALKGGSSSEENNYRVNSFVQAYLQYTTDCSLYGRKNLQIKDVITECGNEAFCLNGKSACEILEEISQELLNKSWDVNEESLIEGYSLKIISEGISSEEMLNIEQGNITNNYQGGFQKYPPRRGKEISVFVNIYY